MCMHLNTGSPEHFDQNKTENNLHTWTSESDSLKKKAIAAVPMLLNNTQLADCH